MTMKSLDQLDQLNLDTDTKLQVVDLVQTLLLDQSRQSRQTIHFQEIKIQALILELAHLRRIRFGQKNEALSGMSPRQLTLFEDSLLTDITAIEAEIEQIDNTPKANTARLPRTRAGRQPLPDHLPRIEHRHEPASCQCDQCGHDLVKIREDITEQLDVEPARFFVHRHIRPQYACRSCETITAEPVPPAVIDGGMAAPGLLAWVWTNKYLNHLPLYRLEQIAAREQVTLSRSTLAEWVGRTGVALQPLVVRLTWHLLQGNTLHVDETPVAQLDPGGGKTRKAYLWAYRSNDLEPGPRIIVFDYQAGRSGRYAQHFLRNWQGHLLVDDYAGYKALFSATTSPCIELGWLSACPAQILRSAPGQCQHDGMGSTATHQCLVRNRSRRQKYLSIEDRQQLRADKSLPALYALHDWLIQTRSQTANGKSDRS